MPKKISSIRADELLIRNNLAKSLDHAKRLIMAGEVLVGDRRLVKPAEKLPVDAPIKVRIADPYVGRGGVKLAAALTEFSLYPDGWVCADVGTSTGGFTDCLLQNGAVKVYAIDSGYGQLAWTLRQDDRVVVMERTNARHLHSLPEPIDFATADVSFISLSLILPVIENWLTPNGNAVVLVKPQFEAPKHTVEEGGVIRDPEVHRVVLSQIIEHAHHHEFTVQGLMPSPLIGPAGNIEFLLWLIKSDQVSEPSIPQLVRRTVQKAHSAHLPNK